MTETAAPPEDTHCIPSLIFMEKDIRDIYPYERYLGAFEHMRRAGRANAKALLGFLAGYLVSTHESIVTDLHMIGRYAPEFATYWVAAKAEPVPPGFFAHAYPGDNTKVFVTLYPPWETDYPPVVRVSFSDRGVERGQSLLAMWQALLPG